MGIPGSLVSAAVEIATSLPGHSIGAGLIVGLLAGFSVALPSADPTSVNVTPHPDLSSICQCVCARARLFLCFQFSLAIFFLSSVAPAPQ